MTSSSKIAIDWHRISPRVQSRLRTLWKDTWDPRASHHAVLPCSLPGARTSCGSMRRKTIWAAFGWGSNQSRCDLARACWGFNQQNEGFTDLLWFTVSLYRVCWTNSKWDWPIASGWWFQYIYHLLSFITFLSLPGSMNRLVFFKWLETGNRQALRLPQNRQLWIGGHAMTSWAVAKNDDWCPRVMTNSLRTAKYLLYG